MPPKQTLDDTVQAHSITAEWNASFSHCRRLPHEILSDILDQSSQPDSIERPMSKTRKLLALCGVCSYWREVARTSSALWRSFDINAGDFVNHLELLRLHFRNIGNGTLAICVDFTNGPKAVVSPNSIIEQLFHENNPSKIRSLILLHIPPRQWDLLAEYARNVPMVQLERLEISLDFIPGTTNSNDRLSSVLFGCSPQLQEIVLRSYFPDVELLFPLDKVTSIHLHNFPIVKAASLLKAYNQLTEYHLKSCKFPHATDSKNFLTSGTLLTLPALEIFGWISFNPYTTATLLRSVRLPSLRVLIWNGPFDISIPSIQCARFFSMTNITTFECTYHGSTPTLLAHLPTLRELRIRHIPNSDLIKDCLARLTVRGGQQSLLPRLTSLKLTVSALPSAMPTLGRVFNVICSRRNGPHLTDCCLPCPYLNSDTSHWQSHGRLEHFWLSQSTMSFYWSADYLIGLQSLVRDGLQLEVTEGWNERPVNLFALI